jgi:hypothetical protein
MRAAAQPGWGSARKRITLGGVAASMVAMARKARSAVT